MKLLQHSWSDLLVLDHLHQRIHNRLQVRLTLACVCVCVCVWIHSLHFHTQYSFFRFLTLHSSSHSLFPSCSHCSMMTHQLLPSYACAVFTSISCLHLLYSLHIYLSMPPNHIYRQLFFHCILNNTPIHCTSLLLFIVHYHHYHH